MGRFRDIKRQMRRDVQAETSVASLYIPAPGATPVPCNVRVHRRSDNPMLGDLPGMGGEATMAATEDRLRFFRSELPSYLRTGAIVSVEAGEAYKVEFYYPKDDEFITARVTPLSEADAEGLPVPNE
jgi:hypothetical protein